MAWAAVAGAVAPALIGGIMGGQGGSNSATQSTQNQLDPNLLPYLYGQGGLMGNVNSLYQQQAGQGGLNPMQTAGLEMQRQTLMNPAYTQGFDQMRNVGMGLMSGGMAGNPFNSQPQMPQMMGEQRGYQQTMPPRRTALMNALGFPSGDPTAAAYQPIQQATAAPQGAAPQMPGAPAQQYGSMPYLGYRPGDPIGGIA